MRAVKTEHKHGGDFILHAQGNHLGAYRALRTNS